MKLNKVWLIELNEVGERYYYLKDDGNLTDIPKEALKFFKQQNCEKYIREKGIGDAFHAQMILRNY